ncbi:hypothetical protein GH714_020887 [Hevea brasiliensis]|uniref:Endonuclease/exonuclease/phosphatase domain-containing protein n=1 Tax=Hevea brasiliensis TaxID=3981 RepID=A0A6A6LL03_HEVBR|nr:hypothetical protein GH714_020887 [Hevea brasiliensis]
MEICSNFSLLSSSFWHIDVLVEVAMLGEWRITGFYGRPNRNERRASWALLRELASQYSYPWVCCGDFNAILTQDEKRGGNFYPTYLVQDFRDAVLQAGLSDVNMNGYKYTWDNARDDDDWVEAKLDRFLANDDWKRRFALSKAAVLDYSSSDHLPILLQVRIFLPRHSPRLFRFENTWGAESGCREIVEEIWSDPSLGSVLEKLQFCSVRLGEWGDNLRKLYKQEIDDCKRVMGLLRGKRDAHSRESFRMAKSKFLDLLRRKESYWRQRAKEFWLKEGDQNTKFFHRKATIRQRKNRIDRLKDDNGNWCDWSTGLEAMITDYFKNIFTSNAGSSNDIIDLVPALVTDDQNVDLMKPWLPDVAFPMVTTTFDFNFGVYMVSDLITDGAWNIDLVNRVFNERDRKLILSIPLRRSSSIDLQFWKHDKREAVIQLAVLTSYRLRNLTQLLAIKNSGRSFGLSQRHQKSETFFGVLYLVLYRPDQDFVLGMFRPQRHVWLASHLGWFSPSTHSFQDWLMRALALFNPNDSATLAYLCWSIWEERNSVVWKSAQPAANSCRLRGLRLKREWDDALVSIRAAIPPTADLPTPQEWKKPGPNWVKLNVDIATNVNSGWTGIGMVVRNEMGSFVACKISRMVVNVLNSMNVENFSMMGGIVSDCRSLINEISCEILFSHVFRSANGVAHALAQATRSFPNAMEWTLSPPEFVTHLLL